MDKLISVAASPLSFIILISIVITVHELGHYFAGRMFNAAAESFSVGFGKSILEVRDKRGTRWRVNWLPLGGFVKFVGELQAPTDSLEAAPQLIGKTFLELNPWQRMVISLGGPVANFIFAILVFAGMGMTLGVDRATEVVVQKVEIGMPAEAAGFRTGDVIVTAGGSKVVTQNDVTHATFLRAGEPVRYGVIREGRQIELIATPEERAERNEVFKVTEKVGRIGLQLGSRGASRQNLNPIEAVVYGVSQTGDAIGNTVNVLRRLVTLQDGLDKMSGPLGIFSMTDNLTDAHMKQQGVSLGQRWAGYMIDFLHLAALLSIGVGFFNLLPIPVLDGGAIVMCLAEVVTGKGVPEQVQRVGLTIGLASLVSFALVITWQDVGRLSWPPW